MLKSALIGLGRVNKIAHKIDFSHFCVSMEIFVHNLSFSRGKNTGFDASLSEKKQ